MKKENRVHTRNEVVVLLHAGGKLTKKAFLLSLDQEKTKKVDQGLLKFFGTVRRKRKREKLVESLKLLGMSGFFKQ